MKLTKVNNLRIAVSRNKQSNNGYGILYSMPNNGENPKTVEEQVAARIDNANRLYNVFFRSDIPDVLDKLFEDLVTQIRNTNIKNTKKTLQEYSGIVDKNGKNNREILLENFSYAPPRKQIRRSMELYVRERLTDKWQDEHRRRAAVEILCCICDGKNYAENIRNVYDAIVNDFIEACTDVDGMEGSRVFVYKTNELETALTELIKFIVRKCNRELYTEVEQARLNEKVRKDIVSQINDAKIINFYWNKKEKKFLDNIYYCSATEDRMDAVVERMRRSMKRGNNRKVAIKLLIALANKSWKATIDAMMNNQKEKEQLIDFIFSANVDYHRLNIIRSVKCLRVRVKIEEENAQKKMLILSSAEDKKKAGINKTLCSYACSKKDANKTLLIIKKILFDYFLGQERRQSEEKYFTEKELWSFPNYALEFFGDDQVESGEDNKSEAQTTLEKLVCQNERINKKLVQERIRYANYGIYKKMISQNNLDELCIYWIKYIKNFVERDYITRLKRFNKNDLYSTNMMKKCWESIIRYLCGKYIDLGKVIYHCAMPENMKPMGECQYGIIKEKYEKGLSSFDYEEIKAEENLQREIAEATVTAISNFTRSILDYEKDLKGREDVVTMSDETLEGIMNKKAQKRILRYFGGESNCVCLKDIEEKGLVFEIKGFLREIRNENFHYTSGPKKELTYKMIEKLFDNDIQAYARIIKDKYYTNNVAAFYDKKTIKEMFVKLYQTSHIREAQIPAFSTVFKRNRDLPTYLHDKLKKQNMCKIESKRVIFDGAVYFLLKEIYYQDFTVNACAIQYFFEAVKVYYEEQGGVEAETKKNYRKLYPYHDAAKNFFIFVNKLRLQDLSFGNICQTILTEYNQQNSKQNKDEIIYKHYKVLMELCVRNAFISYVDDNYAFIKEPTIKDEEPMQNYLETISITCLNYLAKGGMNDDQLKNRYMWYTFAHFIHPRQLNYLVGNFKNYIQFRKSIINRAYYAKEIDEVAKKEWEDSISEKIRAVEETLLVLEFVRGVAGRISNTVEDYYEDAEDYAKYLSQYIDFEIINEGTVFDSLRIFCENTLPDGKIIDIYADEKNPKILRNVELTRMYADGDIVLNGYKKVSVEEIKKYYEEQDVVPKILSDGLCKSKEEQIRVRKQQVRKERITLNDITDIWQIINDLHGKLVSMAYLRERDEMYLLLGFYYLALQNLDGWADEKLDVLKVENVHIRSGYVLYLIVSVFTYGLDFLYEKEDLSKVELEKQGGETSDKIKKFDKKYKESLECVLRLFENTKSDRAINNIRNYIDHFKYFVHHDKSIIDLYNDCYQGLFAYSSKLQKSVWENFHSILEKEYILSEFQTVKINNSYRFELNKDKMFSDKFTFKLKDKTCVKIDAREKEFLEKLFVYLNYKR